MIGRPLSYWPASRRVFDLSLGEMLWSRRTIFMALVVGGPVLLAAIVRVLEIFGMPALRVNGQRIGGMGVFGRGIRQELDDGLAERLPVEGHDATDRDELRARSAADRESQQER